MKTLRPTLSILSGVALATSGMVLSAAPPASADVSWDWSYSGGGSIGGSGMLTTTDERPDSSFLITGIRGTSEGNTITSLLPPGGFEGNDNVLFPAYPQLGGGGVSYEEGKAGEGNLFWRGYYQLREQSRGEEAIQIHLFTANPRDNSPAVPEPSSLLGFITLGGLMLGSTLRKAFK